ncbi:MAG TPA: ROK family protein [Bryobacteraceae bacterium]|jgi:glucokinase|nr:ROK family protein [Bryobacteraceae bacterium]
MNPYSIGVDLGGTNLRAAAIDIEGNLLERVAVQVDQHGGRNAIINNIVTAIHGVRGSVGADGLHGVGIGVPGFIDIDTGIVLKAANLPDLDGYSVRDAIQQMLGTPIILENDANAAALGEQWMGAGKGVKNLVLITLGTGIGGGVIIDGKILHGSVGMAGELGHMTVIPDGNPCGCGNYGCLEKHASATAIAAMGRLLHLGDNNLTSAGVYEMALAGDQRAVSVFQSMGRALGIGIANLINIFNFPLYLLSGGPLPAWDMFAPTMIAEIRRRSFVFEATNTRVERATLGADAGLFGAAYLPFQHQAARAEAVR